MRSIRKAALFIVLLGLVTGLGYSQWLVPETRTKAAELIAGGGNVKGAMDVGDIYIWKASGNLYVEYVLEPADPTDPWNYWYLTETHVEIATSPDDFPLARGNPIPGKFTYSHEHEYVSGYLETIPLNGYTGQLYVAAHAVVCKLGGLEGFELALPSTLELRVSHNSNVPVSYFPTVEIRNDTWLNGMHYNGWCIDLDNTIHTNTWYWADVYSSYEAIPAGIVEKPENLDVVNWVLNQDFVGKPCPLGGIFTGGDVQYAIWMLLDDNPLSSYPSIPNVNQACVDWIYNEALNHDGFTPECGQYVGIILVPRTAAGLRQQALIIKWPLPCGGCETAWAAIWTGTFWAYPFPGRNWATYLWIEIY